MPPRAVVVLENNVSARIDGNAVVLIFDGAVGVNFDPGRAGEECKDRKERAGRGRSEKRSNVCTYQPVIVSGAWFPTSKPSVFAPAGLPPLIEFAWSPRAIKFVSMITLDMGHEKMRESMLWEVRTVVDRDAGDGQRSRVVDAERLRRRVEDVQILFQSTRGRNRRDVHELA
jgi:hypothetical protein